MSPRRSLFTPGETIQLIELIENSKIWNQHIFRTDFQRREIFSYFIMWMPKFNRSQLEYRWTSIKQYVRQLMEKIKRSNFKYTTHWYCWNHLKFYRDYVVLNQYKCYPNKFAWMVGMMDQIGKQPIEQSIEQSIEQQQQQPIQQPLMNLPPTPAVQHSTDDRLSTSNSAHTFRESIAAEALLQLENGIIYDGDNLQVIRHSEESFRLIEASINSDFRFIETPIRSMELPIIQMPIDFDGFIAADNLSFQSVELEIVNSIGNSEQFVGLPIKAEPIDDESMAAIEAATEQQQEGVQMELEIEEVEEQQQEGFQMEFVEEEEQPEGFQMEFVEEEEEQPDGEEMEQEEEDEEEGEEEEDPPILNEIENIITLINNTIQFSFDTDFFEYISLTTTIRTIFDKGNKIMNLIAEQQFQLDWYPASTTATTTATTINGNNHNDNHKNNQICDKLNWKNHLERFQKYFQYILNKSYRFDYQKFRIIQLELIKIVNEHQLCSVNAMIDCLRWRQNHIQLGMDLEMLRLTDDDN